MFDRCCIQLFMLEREVPLEWYKLTQNLHHVC
jgi:hypothetical protein